MSISERDILATALLTIKQHGESAAYYAASRADQLEEQGAPLGRSDVAARPQGD